MVQHIKVALFKDPVMFRICICRSRVGLQYRLVGFSSSITNLITRLWVLLQRGTHPTLYYCYTNVCDAGPTLNQHWVSVQCLLGKPSCQYMRGGQLFRVPAVTKELALKPNAQLRASVELLTHRCCSSIWPCYDFGTCS